MLDADALSALRGKKNLLAFSGGVDSTALFFLLKDAGAEFDIAIVNYNTRESSKAEEEYAKELADRYFKRCFVKSVSLASSNFEAQARRVRYGFFEETIKEHGYENLVTAHQLNDRLEWFLMRLAKGAGVRELVGGMAVQKRESYTLVKPLLKISRDELYGYLVSNNLKYFEDESNLDTKYERNLFRKEFAEPFIKSYKDGVKSSFDILEQEAKIFETPFYLDDSLIVFRSVSLLVDISNSALALKQIGYLPSCKQREEIGKNFDAVVGGAFCVCNNANGLIFVSPFVKCGMQKEFKEGCRVSDIPPKIRGYLSLKNIEPKELNSKLNYFFDSFGGFI